jgi:hypothetical protein
MGEPIYGGVGGRGGGGGLFSWWLRQNDIMGSKEYHFAEFYSSLLEFCVLIRKKNSWGTDMQGRTYV